MAKRVSVRRGANPGDPNVVETTPILGPGTAAFDGAVKAGVEAALGEAALTKAQQRLRELRRTPVASPIHKVTIEGSDWFIRRINFEGINRVMLKTPRDAAGRLMMGDDGVLTALLTAMLEVCCVSGEFDVTPYFENWADAFSQANEEDPAIVVINNALFSTILELNPEIWPEGASSIKKQETAGGGSGDDDAAPLGESSPAT